MNSANWGLIENAAHFLRRQFGDPPTLAVILGSGLSGFSKILESSTSVSSADIPGSVGSSVLGHDGNVFVGSVKGKKIAVLAGRVHGYEGHSPHQVVHLPRALRLWGVRKFVLTNAAGSTKKNLRPGDLVLITDHINFTSLNPLIGKELFGGPRFPDMSDLYSERMRKSASSLARRLNIPLKGSVYLGVNGPSFETKAEISMFSKWGAGLVGMSTVWEAIALKQMGAEILGLSCVTNFGTGVSKKSLSHAEVLEVTQKVAKKFNKWMSAFIEKES